MCIRDSPSSGTEDDDDDRDDEHAGENEASVRANDEGTETPEEFDVEYKDRLDEPCLLYTSFRDEWQVSGTPIVI